MKKIKIKIKWKLTVLKAFGGILNWFILEIWIRKLKSKIIHLMCMKVINLRLNPLKKIKEIWKKVMYTKKFLIPLKRKLKSLISLKS